MASIAGPKIAEIKVRHHARQFGKSKYGLSRIYKVLLDLMVIKTVASFTARPMLWFGMLSLPCSPAAAIAFGWTIVHLPRDAGTLSLPIAGCGVIFLSSAIMLHRRSGALGELVYKLGDLREHEFSGLTQHVRVAPHFSEPPSMTDCQSCSSTVVPLSVIMPVGNRHAADIARALCRIQEPASTRSVCPTSSSWCSTGRGRRSPPTLQRLLAAWREPHR